MSHWTHVNGNVSVRGQRKEVKRIYEEVKDMITGSERNCEITLIHNEIETLEELMKIREALHMELVIGKSDYLGEDVLGIEIYDDYRE